MEQRNVQSLQCADAVLTVCTSRGVSLFDIRKGFTAPFYRYEPPVNQTVRCALYDYTKLLIAAAQLTAVSVRTQASSQISLAQGVPRCITARGSLVVVGEEAGWVRFVEFGE